MTNLNDGVGEACAGQSRDIGSFRTSENRWKSDFWDSLGLAVPIGSKKIDKTAKQPT